LQQWPAWVYRPARVLRVILEATRHLCGGLGGHPQLASCVAQLHCAASQHEAALDLLLTLTGGETDVFTFVELLSLQGLCRGKITLLSRRSWERTLQMILRYPDALPPLEVIAQLESSDREVGDVKLLEYLHGLFTEGAQSTAMMHGRQLVLYAAHAPQHLLPFLRSSPHYPLALALEVCKEYDIIDGQIFLLGRLRAFNHALQLILDRWLDICRAVDFVRIAGQPSLWQMLLARSVESESHIASLLKHSGSAALCSVDTAELVRGLPSTLRIELLALRMPALLTQTSARLMAMRVALFACRKDCSYVFFAHHCAVHRPQRRTLQ